MATSTRIPSLSILMDPAGKDLLQELYGQVIENVEKGTISSILKNRDLSGLPTSGSVEVKRFANATSLSYGTARAAGKGEFMKAKPVVVQIDRDREIVEEIEEKDTLLYGIDGLLTRRSQNHAKSLIRELERSFFTEAVAGGTAVVPTATDANEIIEDLIQVIETTHNDYVDGVDRDMISIVMSTAMYGKMRNFLDVGVGNAHIQTNVESIAAFHGVRVFSSVYLPAGIDAIAMVDGSVAQPVLPRTYQPEKIPLSNAYAVSLFYSYGVKAVTPDLIAYIEEEEEEEE